MLLHDTQHSVHVHFVTRKPSLEVAPTTLATFSADCVVQLILWAWLAVIYWQLPSQVCFSATVGHLSNVAELFFLLRPCTDLWLVAISKGVQPVKLCSNKSNSS